MDNSHMNQNLDRQ